MRELRRLNAWMNDVAIRDIDSRIHVVNITDNEPEMETAWGTNPGQNGQRLLNRTRKSLKVTLEFDIKELYNLAQRAAIVDAVNAWAQSGVLKVSYRDGQRLRVNCTSPAAFNGARDVTSTYTVEFEAAASPYWEDENPTTLTLSGTTGSGTIIVPGSAPAVPEISVKTTGGSMDALTLTFAGNSMEFLSLGMANNKTLKITHTESGWLKIAVGNTSKLNKRTAASADDFKTAPGSVAVSFTAEVACDVTFSVRGRYL